MSKLIDELARSEARLEKAQSIARLGSWELDLATAGLVSSEELRRIYGVGPQERVDTFDTFLRHIHVDDRQLMMHATERAIKTGEPLRVDHRVTLPGGEVRILHVQADVIFDDQGRAVELIGTAQDLTERKQAEEQIRFLAYHDGLTQLGNRRLFTEQLRHALSQARRHRGSVAVLFLDLDDFKRINDTLGHSQGDRLLQDVAGRLKKCVRESDSVSRAYDSDLSCTISRFGGDEFMIALCGIRDAAEAGHVAGRILETFSRPYLIEGQSLVVTASIGIAVSPKDGEDADALIRNADAAMYAAKGAGRAAYRFYEQAMNEITHRNLKLESGLRTALDRGELLVHYQPKMEIKTGRITGFEALARWEHPEMGMVPPDVFIPVAERAGLVCSVGEFVLRCACEQVKIWEQLGLPPVRIAVNLSAHQFRTSELPDIVAQIVEETAVSPRSIEVEITETAMFQHESLAVEVLQRLRATGISVSLDDFGTGYSSLSYLKIFPVDGLKIDRSFIRDLTSDPEDAALTAAIIAMARSLNLNVVAEGVETEEQLEFLRSQNCQELQGYLFSRPLPAAEATEFFKASVAEERQRKNP